MLLVTRPFTWEFTESKSEVNLNSLMTEAVIIRNQSIDLLWKSMDWFLYDNGLRHERVKLYKTSTKIEHFVKVVNCFNPSAIFTKIFQLRQNCPCLELFWFTFSWIWTKYEEIICISPLSFQMRENMDQNNSKYGHVLRSGCLTGFWIRLRK